MHEVVHSTKYVVPSRSRVFALHYALCTKCLFRTCAQIVYTALVELGKLGGFMHHVVFATPGVGINQGFVPRLYKLGSQVSTHGETENNRAGRLVFPTVHRTNSKGNKENTL